MEKTVLITGASRGIGAEIAREFASRGYRVVVNYNRSSKQGKALAEDIGALSIQADVSKSSEVTDMIKQIKDMYGAVDILINNAGVSYTGLLTDMTDDDWNAVFDTNVRGMFNCVRAVLPDMIHKKSGSIVNISSIWGIAGASCEVAYSASKAAVIGFTKALAKEDGPSGIRVNCVAPGVTQTDMLSNLSKNDLNELAEETPIGRLGTTADIAKAVVFLAESEFITGQVLSPNGGIVI